MKQVRFIPIEACGLKVRESEDGQQSRVVEGRAIVFGVRSVNLTPWSSTRKVYEVLEPGCITNELLQRSDVVYNVNHSNKVTDVLGRYRNTEKDTLKLTLRMDGVDNSCDLPNTTTANDTLELIRRGDISGQSFAFEDDWEDTENGVSLERTNEIEDGKEVWIRHVKRITGLYDVSIVTHPAYEQTSVATREQGDAILRQIDEQIEAQKRACGGGKPKENECGGCDNGETDEEKAKREQAEREANGGETNAEKEAREAAEREANGGETNAEKQAREEREMEEAAQRHREQRELQLRAKRMRTRQDFESLDY